MIHAVNDLLGQFPTLEKKIEGLQRDKFSVANQKQFSRFCASTYCTIEDFAHHQAEFELYSAKRLLEFADIKELVHSQCLPLIQKVATSANRLDVIDHKFGIAT